MKICKVENNLVSFLTAIYHFYYTYKDIEYITSDSNTISMLDDSITVIEDTALAKKVREGIIKKVGMLGYNEIADAYLSCDSAKEQKIFEYLKLLFTQGKKVFTMFSHEVIIAFNDMLKKVRHEAHRMTGFIRFQEMENGIYYSYFGPDNDILELIIPHFRTRFNDQQFVLHDIIRNKMAYYDGNNVQTLIAPEKLNILISQNEILFSKLWKEYFHNVSIENRTNLRVQNQYLPKKYRWFMNEF